jgi:hypothetical protein
VRTIENTHSHTHPPAPLVALPPPPLRSKLEQELRSLQERADGTAARSRGGLETLRGRLAEVERSVHQQAVEGQRLHSMVQGVQAAAMPLAVAAASAAAAAGGPGAAAAHALKSPLPGSSGGRAVQQRVTSQPEQLHRQFAQLFGGLSALSDLFAGGPGSSAADGSAVTNPAPLLLTAPDGSTKAVHWADRNSPTNPAAPCASSSSGGTSRHIGPSAPGAAAAPAAAGNQEKQRLVAEVRHLRAALAEARQHAAAASAEAAAAAAASASSARAGSSGRVEAAMKQLDAVVPQYRAAAQALQGQAQVLKEKLTAAARERAALQDEASGCCVPTACLPCLSNCSMCSPGSLAARCSSPPDNAAHPACMRARPLLCRWASGGALHRSTRRRLQRQLPSCTPGRRSLLLPALKCRCARWLLFRRPACLGSCCIRAGPRGFDVDAWFWLSRSAEKAWLCPCRSCCLLPAAAEPDRPPAERRGRHAAPLR